MVAPQLRPFYTIRLYGACSHDRTQPPCVSSRPYLCRSLLSQTDDEEKRSHYIGSDDEGSDDEEQVKLPDGSHAAFVAGS